MSNEVEQNPSMPADEPMKALVTRAQSGERQALDELIRRFQKPMYNLAFRMVNNREDADDLTQEIFVRMVRAIDKFRGESEFGTWLYALAANICRSGLRRLRRVASFEVVRLDEVQVQADSDRPPMEAVDPAELPGKTMERKEVAQRIQEIVAALPEELKTILILRDMQGLAYEEIAAALGCNMGTVKSRLFRARLAAKAKLSREGLLCAVKK